MNCTAGSSTSLPVNAEVATAESLYGGPEADSIFSRSASLWQARLRHAKSNPDALQETPDLRECLRRTPQLPRTITPSSKWIEGHSTWTKAESSCSLRSREEKKQRIFLSKLHPTVCSMSATRSFRNWGKNANNGIGLLTLGWAYILSAELAERQGLSMEYGLVHEKRHNTAYLDLHYAFPKERRWWKAIVTRGTGWSITGGRIAPWAITVDDIGTQLSEHATGSHQPPTAHEAACYLSRLCHVYDLGNQASAALAAALTIPLHASTDPLESAKIELPRPNLDRCVRSPCSAPTPAHFESIGYYMTLSLCPRALGSSLWSVFWDPDVPCNFAGAWLVPIATLLEPIILSNNMELLAKVLSTHNISPLWLGVALCGRGALINSILPSLTKLRDFPFFRPSIDAAAWTGAAQSFFESSQTPLGFDCTVSRADVWRLRHDCSKIYADDTFSHTPPYGWPPFGRMQATDVELEIREHLACSHEWEYSHWNWSLGGTDPGFSVNSSHVYQTPGESWTVAGRVPHINSKKREMVYRVSEVATKAIFWWSCGQVERGFGGTIVPYRSGPDEVLESNKSCHHIEPKSIIQWLETLPQERLLLRWDEK